MRIDAQHPRKKLSRSIPLLALETDAPEPENRIPIVGVRSECFQELALSGIQFVVFEMDDAYSPQRAIICRIHRQCMRPKRVSVIPGTDLRTGQRNANPTADDGEQNAACHARP